MTLELKSNGALFLKKHLPDAAILEIFLTTVKQEPPSSGDLLTFQLFSPLHSVQFRVAMFAPNCPFLPSSSHFHSPKEELLLRPEKALALCACCGGKPCLPHRSRLSGRRVKFQVVVFTAHHNKDLRTHCPISSCLRLWETFALLNCSLGRRCTD